MTDRPLPYVPPLDDVDAVLAWAKAENDRAERVLADARAYLDETEQQ